MMFNERTAYVSFVLRSSSCSPVHLNSNFSFGILRLVAYMTFGTLRVGFLPTIFFEGLSEQVKAQMVNSSERVPPLQAIRHSTLRPTLTVRLPGLFFSLDFVFTLFHYNDY